MEISTILNLDKSFFGSKRKELIRHSGITVYTFQYSTGVDALEVINLKGRFILLPYQGQQIWKAEFLGRQITMKSMFEEPVKTTDFLKNYGGFLVHCGATAMGVPQKEDNHPQHGELPNAAYNSAYIRTGVDAGGKYAAFGGFYNHKAAFTVNYLANPEIKIYEDSSVFDITMKIRNIRKQDMDLMYLMHVNFRPVDGSTLYYSSLKNNQNVRVFNEVPIHFKTDPQMSNFIKFLDELEENPSLHNEITNDKPFNPEILFSINYLCDNEGYAHSIQENPDGYSQYISHRINELDHGLRWISRSAEEDAIGIVLPATAEHKGYSAEKSKGNIKVLKYNEMIEFSVRAGILDKDRTKSIKDKIDMILNQ